MVKFSSSDILRILTKFEIAGDEDMPRYVEQLKMTHPHEKNTLFSFRFKKQQYYVLVDSAAEDDSTYILDQIYSDKTAAAGRIVANPNDDFMTYGMPYKGKDVYLYAVATTKHRLDLWLSERNPDLSRSAWQKHIKAGHISVNDSVQTSAKYDISDDDTVTITMPEQTDYSSDSLPIVYQDDNVIVINKPAGVLTHAKGALNDEFTVAEFFSRFTTYNSETNRPGIVHRLDRDTSGVMIGARNEQTAKQLQKQFADRKVKKTYVALLDGVPKESPARIDVPIGRNPTAPSTFRADSKGKSAQTNYEVVASDGKESLAYLSPETGRTHQLRVHMAYINTPIHGDRVYGKEADRMYLHAYRLEVTIPDGQRKVFEAPIPQEFMTRIIEEDNA